MHLSRLLPLSNMQSKDRLIRMDFSEKRSLLCSSRSNSRFSNDYPKNHFGSWDGFAILSWIAFGHIVGIYSPASIIVGITIHILTAISIGIISGIILYESGVLNISKISNDLIFGLLAGYDASFHS